ncbi:MULTISPECIES: cytochrome c oxidase subunit 3 [Citromicrobium]|uniref:cytochrome c oxidase subunit 3 n=1 Tax=Citromicrobium TaxID=72173 RepID=UPI0001DD06EC|nr:MULTISPECIES: cytochrome c oxidase subunit 3 [Citromicrobium]ALG61621.1 cytochrome o ubiquinol oxidase subunit III [Citromicrobium sp. JL477]KPM12932.1 cytochrome o ubiquinol oxidase subunit III [Citromicrobium sp. JL1351]KPM21037.1 cytochrome o ubiquinol oxidase subunit III [Citromicrobium sp. JL31]KPM27023.1 cytochrome o ubiquinol oxidase subunit III [Citromicrobium sp. JL2201]
MSDNGLYPGLNLGATHGEAHEDAEKTVFGFWVFLMSDLIIFGILFASYASYLDPIGMAGGPGPKDLFDLTSVAIQTAFLLVGGIAYAGVSLALKYDQGREKIIAWLLVCAVLGAGFLFFEVKDFIAQAGEGGVPQASGWLSSYWALVGLHGIHVFSGILWIFATIGQIATRGLDDVVKVRLSMLGVFWHFLDLIWVGIFSLVFLVPLA